MSLKLDTCHACDCAAPVRTRPNAMTSAFKCDTFNCVRVVDGDNSLCQSIRGNRETKGFYASTNMFISMYIFCS